MRLRMKFYCVAAAGFAVVWFVYLFLPRAPEPIARPTIRHILLWTTSTSFNKIAGGFDGFFDHKCECYNCFVTNNKKLMPQFTDFDAIAFSGKGLEEGSIPPDKRAPYQKYIFAAMESPIYYPVCDEIYDNFFNWTWTYRIDSDFRWGYIKIYNLDGNLVGPKIDMKWSKLSPIGEELKNKLDSKSKGAAWFVSNCATPGKREAFFLEMQRELNATDYNWSVDAFGGCGPYQCKEKACYEMVELYYHFYLSFENSFAKDYVTEKLMTALNHYAIPVVYGGADYSRFLPPGSYLNARELGAKALIQKMNEIFNDKEKYYEYFKWRNHYKYEHSLERDVCDLCKAFNDEEKMKPYVYGDFRRWWNEDWDKNSQYYCKPKNKTKPHQSKRRKKNEELHS